MKRDELLAKNDAAHRRLAELLADLPEQRLLEPGPTGWSIKDQLWHVADWQQYVADLLSGRPTRPATKSDDEMHAYNARSVAEGRARSLGEVREALDRSYRELRLQVEGLTDEELDAPTRYWPTWQRKQWQHIAGNAFDHYQEHIQTIESALASAP